jgi:hypothetical protein
MAHQITVRDARGVTTYTHADSGAGAAHQTDALSRLCRKLCALGLKGAAEVRGADGSLRFIVPMIEKTAQQTLRESDAEGLRWHPYRPRPEHLQEAGACERERLSDAGT